MNGYKPTMAREVQSVRIESRGALTFDPALREGAPMKVKVFAAAVIAVLSITCGTAIAGIPRDGGVTVTSTGVSDAVGGYEGILGAPTTVQRDSADSYSGVSPNIVVVRTPAPAPRSTIVTQDVGDEWRVATIALAATLVALGAFGVTLAMHRRKEEPVLVEPEPEVVA